MFFLRAGHFENDGFGAISGLIGALAEEATDQDPGKWCKLRDFRKNFSLGDLLHKAVAADAVLDKPPGR